MYLVSVKSGNVDFCVQALVADHRVMAHPCLLKNNVILLYKRLEYIQPKISSFLCSLGEKDSLLQQ